MFKQHIISERIDWAVIGTGYGSKGGIVLYASQLPNIFSMFAIWIRGIWLGK